VIEQRLEHLSPEAQQVLRWASVVGPVFWEGVIEEIGQISGMQVQAALQEGLDQELIVQRDTSVFAGEPEYTFVHPAGRQVSYAGISAGERQEYHGRVAAWLIVRSGEEVGEYPGLIADHLEGAGQTERVVSYLRRAGEQAAAQFANAEAIAYFSRALDLMSEDDATKQLAERYELLLAREKVYHLQGMREAQEQDLVALQELSEALDDDRRRIEVALCRADYALDTINYSMVITAAQEVINLAQATQDVSSETRGYLAWGSILWKAGEPKAAQPYLERAVSLAREAELRWTEAESLRNLGAALVYQQEYVEAWECNEQVLRLYRELGDRQGESKTLSSLGDIPWRLGNFDESRDYFEQALRLSREIGARANEAMVLVNLSLVSRLLGETEVAREYGQQALLIAQEIDEFRVQGYALMLLGHALAGLGRLAEAVESYQQALTQWRETGQHDLAMESLAGLARVSLAQEDLPQAQAQVKEILSYLETDTLEGTDEPFRIYLTCYYVLRANKDPRAQDILETTRRLLQEQVARISDEELRRSFLENVPAHREILSDLVGEEEIYERILRSDAMLAVEDREKELEKSLTDEQLASELAAAHRRIAELEAAEVQRKRAEETLWESEKRFHSITETASDAIIIFDAYQNIFLWNRAAQKTFGYRVGEVRGQPLASMLSEEFHAVFQGVIEEVMATGDSDLLGKVIEVIGIRKDGSEFPLELSLAIWAAKEKVFFTAIGRDITERKEAEKALQKAYAEMEKRVEERTAELRRETAERERLQQEVIEAQKQALQELSTPIIPVMERIIVMPLIGSIDTMRAKDIMRALLAGIRQHQAKVVILDITGVPIVDSGVANHLHKTIQAARLKGTHTIVTGTSEAVAEAIVDLGIDWSGIETLADLQTGLRVALARMGQRVVGKASLIHI
jgi:PAS domain S-box-containing protein